MRELAKRLAGSGQSKVIVNCVTPGACHTDIHREFTGWKMIKMAGLKMIIARTSEMGSRALISGIVAGDDSHGQYLADAAISRSVFGQTSPFYADHGQPLESGTK